MRPGAHIQAAIEVLDEIVTRHRPAATALADWGKAHRFAGSGDRAAIGNLVYDVLRRKRSLAARMESDATRAVVLAELRGALAAVELVPAAVVTATGMRSAATTSATRAQCAGGL